MVSNQNNKYTTKSHCKTLAKKPKKRSSLKRIAALLAAGVLTIGVINLIKSGDKIPEENEYTHNTIIDMDNSEKSQLMNLIDRFNNLSADSRSEDLNSFAKDLRDFQSDTVEDTILELYNKENPNSTSDYVTLHGTSMDGPSFSYSAELSSLYGSTGKFFLEGSIFENVINNMDDLENFDVYKDGYDKLKECANRTFETLQKDYVFSYNSKDKKITAYELEKNQTQNKVQNRSEENERDDR